RPLGLRRAGPPAQHVEDALRRRAVRVEEVRPVEMVRHRPVVVTGQGRAACEAADSGSGEPRNGGDGTATGEFHLARLWSNAGNCGAAPTLTWHGPLPRFR